MDEATRRRITADYYRMAAKDTEGVMPDLSEILADEDERLRKLKAVSDTIVKVTGPGPW